MYRLADWKAEKEERNSFGTQQQQCQLVWAPSTQSVAAFFYFFWLLYYAQQYTVYTVYIMDIRLDHLFQCDSRHLYKLTASHPNEKRKKHEEKFKKNDVGRKFYFKVTHDHEIRLQSHTTPLSIYHQPFTTTPTPQ